MSEGKKRSAETEVHRGYQKRAKLLPSVLVIDSPANERPVSISDDEEGALSDEVVLKAHHPHRDDRNFNLFQALHDLKETDPKPDDFYIPLPRDENATKAAQTMRGLLRRRKEMRLSKPSEVSHVEPENMMSFEPSRPRSVSSSSKTSKSTRSSLRKSSDDEESVEIPYWKGPSVSKVPWFKFIGHDVGEDWSRREKSIDGMNWNATQKNARPNDSCLQRYLTEKSFFLRLHEEISAFVTWSEPTNWEVQKRLEILSRLHLVAKALWPTCRIIPFGSFCTGLSLPNGDVDVCIVDVPEGRPAELILELVRALKRCKFARNLTAITKARIPIAKFVDEASGVQVDISINQPSAAETSNFIREQLEIWPSLRPLILTTKSLFRQLDLNETYKGGVGSYMLFTMCLGHLQAEIKSGRAVEDLNLGYLLYSFLDRYSHFDYYFDGIDVRGDGAIFDKIEMTNKDVPDALLCIKSPLEPETDVGKNSYKWSEVVDLLKWRVDRLETISKAESRLLEMKGAGAKRALKRLREGSLLAAVLRPDDRVFQRREMPKSHPSQASFSIYSIRAIPTIPTHMLAAMRRSMESSLLRIGRPMHEGSLVRTQSAAAAYRSRDLYGSRALEQHQRDIDNSRPPTYRSGGSVRTVVMAPFVELGGDSTRAQAHAPIELDPPPPPRDPPREPPRERRVLRQST